MIERIFSEAGFPPGVFQSLIIEVNLVEGIISSDVIQGVALTGSEAAGSQVGSIAGKNIKRTVLELGGSDAFVVLDDADLENTIKIATQSRMQNVGQSCIAAKRFIVLEVIKEKFIAQFAENIQSLVQGDPFNEKSTAWRVSTYHGKQLELVLVIVLKAEEKKPKNRHGNTSHLSMYKNFKST